jgi:hypothetical protein
MSKNQSYLIRLKAFKPFMNRLCAFTSALQFSGFLLIWISDSIALSVVDRMIVALVNNVFCMRVQG